jgi:hypothetical protein
MTVCAAAGFTVHKKAITTAASRQRNALTFLRNSMKGSFILLCFYPVTAFPDSGIVQDLDILDNS